MRVSPTQEDFLLQVENLQKWYPVSKRGLPKQSRFVRAVDGVSFFIRRKELLGLVGEVGTGKTTLGKLLVRLIEPTNGAVQFGSVNLLKVKEGDMGPFRRKMQIIYEDPFDSLNPRMTVYDIIREPVLLHKLAANDHETHKLVTEILDAVGLSPPGDFFRRYPYELSGGQRQRVAIARALVLRPELIVADEPVSMLDVSVRAGILKLILELRDKFGLSFLLITNDLAVARLICDRIGVMYLGHLVEIGPADDVVAQPYHPYTLALVKAAPRPDPEDSVELIIKGEMPSGPININGCKFHTRCPFAEEICRKEVPKLREIQKNHFAACHRVEEILDQLRP